MVALRTAKRTLVTSGADVLVKQERSYKDGIRDGRDRYLGAIRLTGPSVSSLPAVVGRSNG